MCQRAGRVPLLGAEHPPADGIPQCAIPSSESVQFHAAANRSSPLRRTPKAAVGQLVDTHCHDYPRSDIEPLVHALALWLALASAGARLQ